jgi:SAM-dependent methyltransferase
MDKSMDWQGHSGKVMDAVKGFDVIECTACGFRHIVPIPSPKELEEVYRQDYYAKEKPQNFERFREDLDWWNLVYDDQYEFLEEVLGASRRRILDIGSGPGYFLLQGKKRGWQCKGVEPSTQSVAYSRELGLDVVEDFLGEHSVAGLGEFDVVHLGHVLEHIPQPQSFLGLIKKLLLPAGLVCLVVPNDYNPFQQALREVCGFKPWWVSPPHHINYFDFASLEELLTKHGFRTLRRQATFPIDMFLLMGDNYIGNNDLGRVCHGRRKAFEQNLHKAGLAAIQRKLYDAFAEVGIGREIVLIAELVS